MPPCIVWGVASSVHHGEVSSGDDFVVRQMPHGALVAVVDGLGHGEEAAAAAKVGLASLANGEENPLTLMTRCHERLRGTRGAALSLASFDLRDDSMSWIGVGNVEAKLWRADPRGGPPTESLLLRSGIVGLYLPALNRAVVRVRPGDTLILSTDGIREGFHIDLAQTPQKIADAILERHTKGTDDALVLAARYQGRDP